ncbi:MAG: RNA 2',3'-cyclic phosphodiesterase [Candidatus Aenigmarchaeota archaeon]|nr:RNA 2',3'-cyclic phosphodiesterase [Candidatus Aenigmarchaeota archaeon]
MRCFIAVDLADMLKAKIAEVQQKIADKGMSIVKPDNLHVTLKFLGELDELKVNKVCHVLAGIKQAIFEISLSGLGVFPSYKNPKVAWVGIEGKELKDLTNLIEQLLAENGFPKEDREFNAHLTIARIKDASRDFYKKSDGLKDVKIGKQVVKEFSLKKSTLLPTGPVYENIRKFDLS